MKTRFLVVGGGLSGLLMGMELSKQSEDYIIIEKNGSSPEAKLHYLHDDLTDYLPFPLRKIDIVTNVFWNNKLYSQPTIDMMNYFSYTTLGKITQNSMKFIDGSIHKGWVPVEGIEKISRLVQEQNNKDPWSGIELIHLDLIKKVAKIKVIEDNGVLQDNEIEYQYLISTIPLPYMSKLAGIENLPEFKTEPIKMTEVKLNQDCFEDLYQIVYIPQAELGYARFSILGNRVVAEKANGNFEATEGANRIGLRKLIQLLLPNCDLNKVVYDDQVNWYGRYIPIKEKERLKIINILKDSDIYCLGRYAEWDYKRTDHIVREVRDIYGKLK